MQPGQVCPQSGHQYGSVYYYTGIDCATMQPYGFQSATLYQCPQSCTANPAPGTNLCPIVGGATFFATRAHATDVSSFGVVQADAVTVAGPTDPVDPSTTRWQDNDPTVGTVEERKHWDCKIDLGDGNQRNLRLSIILMTPAWGGDGVPMLAAVGQESRKRGRDLISGTDVVQLVPPNYYRVTYKNINFYILMAQNPS